MAAKGDNPHVICALLGKLVPPEAVLPAQLSAPSWQLAQRVVARLMAECKVYSVNQRANRRALDVQREKKDGLGTVARRERSRIFRQAFSADVWKEASKLGFKSSFSRTVVREFKADMTSQRKVLHAIMAFLLENAPSQQKKRRFRAKPSPASKAPAAGGDAVKSGRGGSSPASTAARPRSAKRRPATSGGGSDSSGQGRRIPEDPEPEPADLTTLDRLSLEQENKRLRAALKEARASQLQLLDEGGSERWEERRVLLLKSQNMQLEEQIVALREAAEQRQGYLQDVADCARALQDRLDACEEEGMRGARDAFMALRHQARKLEIRAFGARTARLVLPDQYRSGGDGGGASRSAAAAPFGRSSRGFGVPESLIDLNRVHKLEQTLATLIPGLEHLSDALLRSPLILTPLLPTGAAVDGGRGDPVALGRIGTLSRAIQDALVELSLLSCLAPTRTAFPDGPPPAARAADALRKLAAKRSLSKGARVNYEKLASLAEADSAASQARELRAATRTHAYQLHAAGVVEATRVLQQGAREVIGVMRRKRFRQGIAAARRGPPEGPFDDPDEHESANVEHRQRLADVVSAVKGIEKRLVGLIAESQSMLRQYAAPAKDSDSDAKEDRD